jgi:hypothetical protein
MIEEARHVVNVVTFGREQMGGQMYRGECSCGKFTTAWKDTVVNARSSVDVHAQAKNKNIEARRKAANATGE